jgi:high-affinity Fe2+/Pb2+ permease
LIDKQATEIDVLRENVALKDQVIKLLTENGQLKDERAAEKDKQIAAEKSAREATEKQLAIETKEKEKAQRSAKFWRKVGTVAGAAAGVLIFGALH